RAPLTPAPSPPALHDALPISSSAYARPLDTLLPPSHRVRFLIARTAHAPRAHNRTRTRAQPDGGLVANAPHLPVHLGAMQEAVRDRKSTRLNSSHVKISYAVF